MMLPIEVGGWTHVEEGRRRYAKGENDFPLFLDKASIKLFSIQGPFYRYYQQQFSYRQETKSRW